MHHDAKQMNRRGFLGQMAVAGAAITASPLLKAEEKGSDSKFERKIKVGIVGCGGARRVDRRPLQAARRL